MPAGVPKKLMSQLGVKANAIKLARSAKVVEDAAALEAKLTRRPERERLEGRGVIKGKEAHKMHLLSRESAAQKVENMLKTRPERERLEARGLLKDTETDAQRKQGLEENAKNLEEKLRTRPTPEELQAKGLLKEAPGDEEANGIPGYDWRPKSDKAFYDLDINASDTVDHDEMSAVLGVEGMDVLSPLMDEVVRKYGSDEVTLAQWVEYMAQVEADQGLDELISLLNFVQSKADKYRALHGVNPRTAVWSPKSPMAEGSDATKTASSEESEVAARLLEDKLCQRPSLDHLKDRGIIKEAVEEVYESSGGCDSYD